MNDVLKERADLARAQWNQLVLSVVATERALRGLGHHREAEWLIKYEQLFRNTAAHHCATLEANGHNKDSHPEAVTQPAENQQAPLVEEGATDGGHVDVAASPQQHEQDVAPAPVSDVVPIPLETVVQRRIEELTPLEREEQRYEVAIKMLYRARSILESGVDDKGRPTKREDKQQLAWKLIKSAEQVLAQESEVAHG